jgi:peptidoglycan DL-endopeptidase CwlO
MIPGFHLSGRARTVVIAAVIAACAMAAGLLVTPVLMFASGGLLAESGTACSQAQGGAATQPVASDSAQNSIPADYLMWFQRVGRQFGVPWVVLAGIGKVESDDGQSTLPGVHSGWNPFGAAGPMQIGVTGAAGNQWGGAPVHPASEKVDGVATDETGDGIASVYVPADAIAGAAKYLLEHGVLDNVDGAIFAYNHLESYVQLVLYWAGVYARGGYTVEPVTVDNAPDCIPGVSVASTDAAATVIAYAEAQLGKPYQWGATGPDSFDCSGLTMMAYRAAGLYIPRTSQEQWLYGKRIPSADVQPGDLVFFAGSDGTITAPGHVGIVIGKGMMIDAPFTGAFVRVEPYGEVPDLVGFTDPQLVGHRAPGA